jgi:hypothetical protein
MPNPSQQKREQVAFVGMSSREELARLFGVLGELFIGAEPMNRFTLRVSVDEVHQIHVCILDRLRRRGVIEGKGIE